MGCVVRGFLVAACVAACLVVGGAHAAAYDDFMRGFEAIRAGNIDAAIEAYSAALAPGDLAATYVPNAYFGRAQAYGAKGECAKAEADLDKAIALRPTYLDAVRFRAGIRQCLNKYEDARADFDAAIKLSPTSEQYRARADFFWYHAKFDSAAADYFQAADLSPTNSYYAQRRGYHLLWYAISAVRANSFDAAAFKDRAEKVSIDGWPDPLIRFALGKIETDEVYTKAARGDAPLPAQQKCEADFYLGEWQIGHGDAGGKALLQQAAQTCPNNFVEYHAAKAELKRLP